MIYRATLVTSILALLLTATTGPATAATYNVQSCKEFVREHLPPTDWRFAPQADTFEIRTDCIEGPIALRTRGGAVTPYGRGAGITFAVPEPLSIVGYKGRHFLRTPQSADTSRPWRWKYETFATSLNGDTFVTSYCNSTCTGYFANPGWALPRPIRSMNWQLACELDTRTDRPSGAEITIFDAEFTVDDPTVPQLLEPPTGAVFSGGVDLAGEQTVSFKAADTGTGIYRAVVEIDGAVAGASTANHAEYPTCVHPFRVAQPCPATFGNGITFSTHDLSDGSMRQFCVSMTQLTRTLPRTVR